jgi:hypothetical protein
MERGEFAGHSSRTASVELAEAVPLKRTFQVLEHEHAAFSLFVDRAVVADRYPDTELSRERGIEEHLVGPGRAVGRPQLDDDRSRRVGATESAAEEHTRQTKALTDSLGPGQLRISARETLRERRAKPLVG